MSAAYRPTVAHQCAKLRSKQPGWMLAGHASVTDGDTRTRNGGLGRPTLKKKVLFEQSSSSSDEFSSEDLEDDHSSTTSNEEDDTLSEGEAEPREEEVSPKKPPSTRVIVEVESVTTSFEKHCRCLECGGPVEMTMRTIFIATSLMITCKDPKCAYVFHSIPPALVDVESSDNHERSTDYAVNILYVIGFLSCGDGCTEAARLLGLLGLPNDTTMETRSFSIIEERISPAIRQLTATILQENLAEEVQRSMVKSNTYDEHDFELWKRALNDETVVLGEHRYPKLSVSYDMAWQQRNSGNRYASPSGHALLVGALTRKPICFAIKSKLCNFCTGYAKRQKHNDDGTIPEHDCTKNHVGSSSSMEPLACLEMVVEMYNKWHCIIEFICADDDASTRSMLRWNNEDYMRNNNTN